MITMRRMDRKKQEWKQEDAMAVIQARDAGGLDLSSESQERKGTYTQWSITQPFIC